MTRGWKSDSNRHAFASSGTKTRKVLELKSYFTDLRVNRNMNNFRYTKMPPYDEKILNKVPGKFSEYYKSEYSLHNIGIIRTKNNRLYALVTYGVNTNEFIVSKLFRDFNKDKRKEILKQYLKYYDTKKDEYMESSDVLLDKFIRYDMYYYLSDLMGALSGMEASYSDINKGVNKLKSYLLDLNELYGKKLDRNKIIDVIADNKLLFNYFTRDKIYNFTDFTMQKIYGLKKHRSRLGSGWMSYYLLPLKKKDYKWGE